MDPFQDISADQVREMEQEMWALYPDLDAFFAFLQTNPAYTDTTLASDPQPSMNFQDNDFTMDSLTPAGVTPPKDTADHSPPHDLNNFPPNFEPAFLYEVIPPPTEFCDDYDADENNPSQTPYMNADSINLDSHASNVITSACDDEGLQRTPTTNQPIQIIGRKRKGTAKGEDGVSASKRFKDNDAVQVGLGRYPPANATLPNPDNDQCPFCALLPAGETCTSCADKGSSRARTFRSERGVYGTFSKTNVLDAPESNPSITEVVNQHEGDIREVLLNMLHKPTDVENKEKFCEGHFKSETVVLLNDDNLDEQLANAKSQLTSRVDSFETMGSGWKCFTVDKLQVFTTLYDPVGGSSYFPTPPWIKNKKAALNIKNRDNKCFLYCLAAHVLKIKENAVRVNNYKKFIKQFNIKDLEFPLKVKDIKTFENLNPDFAINVVYPDDDNKGHFLPLFASEHRNRKHVVNLLLLRKEDKYHYILVRDLSKLLASRSKHKAACYPCPYCLNCYWKKEGLDKHLPDCGTKKPQAIKFPKTDKEKFLKFQNIQNQMAVPFAIYADFECFLPKVDSSNASNKNTVTTELHEPSGFCALTVSQLEEFNDEEAFVYSGSDPMTVFFEHLRKEHARINKILSRNVRMKALDREQYAGYRNATNCPYCNTNLTNENKVKHHDHQNGEYLAAVCNDCNLKLKYRKAGNTKSYLVPVIFHNLKGYDSHIILKHLTRRYCEKDIDVIATNTEKYLSFDVKGLRFIDSLQFLNCSLQTLAENLLKDGKEKFHNVRRHFPNDAEYELLLRKGVFCYEYMTSADKMIETCLPPKDEFFSHLMDAGITDDDYVHAQTVWTMFGMKTLQDYHDLYLKSDVLLLADVFEQFRKVSIENYDLDPLHYYSSPGLSFDAGLKMTGVTLELFTDPEQLLFIERGMRGGVSVITNRYARANNSKLADYDVTEPDSHIIYYDCGNLYGKAMSLALPTGGFRYLNDAEIENFDLSSKGSDDNLGYILEVDLDYPSELHDVHNDYPLAPEQLGITKELLSPYSRHLADKLGMKTSGEHVKLTPNLMDKKNYIVHYRNLQLYLNLGLKLVKIHKILEFQQSEWLKTYIDFNTKKRQAAKSSFEKDFYKLLNNSIFGKTMENLRKRVDVRIVTSIRRAKRFAARPTFESFHIINEDVVVLQLRKASVYQNKPMYVGFSILELSKHVMYDFHYNHISKVYGNRAKLLFTDTDSLCYHIRTKDVYEDMLQHLVLYDTSEYPSDHPCFSKTNAKVVGKFKDETAGVPIKEFVGLRSKMYSMILSNDKEKRTAKGIKKQFADKYIRHEMYKECLQNELSTTAKFRNIRSQNHQLQTVEITKSALSPYDDKRYLLSNSSDTLAYGHYKIKLLESTC